MDNKKTKTDPKKTGKWEAELRGDERLNWKKERRSNGFRSVCVV